MRWRRGGPIGDFGATCTPSLREEHLRFVRVNSRGRLQAFEERKKKKATPGPKATIYILVSSHFSAREKSRNQRAEATPSVVAQPKNPPEPNRRVLRANNSRPPPTETPKRHAGRGGLSHLHLASNGNGQRLPFAAPRGSQAPLSSLLGKTTTAAPGRNPTKRAVTTTPFLVRRCLEEPSPSPPPLDPSAGLTRQFRGADRSLTLILSRRGEEGLVGCRFRAAAGVARIFRFLGFATCVCDADQLPPGVPRRRRRHCRRARARHRGPRRRRRRRRGLHRQALLRQTQQLLLPPPP